MTLIFLALAALPFVISPGASFTITIGAIAQGEQRVPLRVWAGTAVGIALIASVAGVSRLGQFVAGNDTARTAFGVVGGAILMGFGVMSLFRTIGRPAHADSAEPSKQRLVLWSFTAVITNVKALSLYVLVVPTLTSVGLDGWELFAAFAAVHIAMLLLWLVAVGFLMGAIPGIAQSNTVRTVLVATAALTLILLGAATIHSALP